MMPLCQGWLALTTRTLLTTLLAASTAFALRERREGGRAARSHLGWDSRGRLAFVQLHERWGEDPASWAEHMDLYPVEVGFDLQAMDASKGVTMTLDRKLQKLRAEPGVLKEQGIAWGTFDDRIDTTGWSELNMQTSDNPSYNNDVTMYSAGYAEGLLTCVRISDFFANVHGLLVKKDMQSHALTTLKAMFTKEIRYLKTKANMQQHELAQEPEDTYWKHARYVLFQLWGLCDGYNYAARKFGVNSLSLEDMLVLNSGGELPNLMDAFTPEAIQDRAQAQSAPPPMPFFLQRRAGRIHETLNRRQAQSNVSTSNRTSTVADPLSDAAWEHRMADDGRCSALVRVADGNIDLLVGHATWDDYSKMTRIYKYYNFGLSGAETASTKVSMSSYPGVVSSTDDFYILSSGLTVMETSLEILDSTVWDNVLTFPANPHIPNFIHLMVTNRMAKSAAQWARLYSLVNTGTYTSQWMALDYKQFISGNDIMENTLWIVEAIPGLLHMEDMSHHLQKNRYWPSFNRPFFPNVREFSGHAPAERMKGALYSWSGNPRAVLFAGNAGAVNTLFDMRNLMNRNKYPNAGYPILGPGALPNEPGHEIAARMDLSPLTKIPNGAIDAKVASRCLVYDLKVQAISGPSHETQAPFRWKAPDGADLWPGYPHFGLPDVWNFDYVQMSNAEGFTPLVDAASC